MQRNSSIGVPRPHSSSFSPFALSYNYFLKKARKIVSPFPNLLFPFDLSYFLWLKSSIYLVINLRMAIGLAMPDWLICLSHRLSLPFPTGRAHDTERQLRHTSGSLKIKLKLRKFTNHLKHGINWCIGFFSKWRENKFQNSFLFWV